MSLQTRQQVARAVKAVESKKADDVVILEMDQSSGAFTDYFIVCSGTNPRQIQAISDEIGVQLKQQAHEWPKSVEGYNQAEWVLADIPNFPFHYTRHTCAQDREASFCLIKEELFDDPLRNVAGQFDLIVIHEVFEHLHKPRHLAEYLLNRLNPGGLFFFDYVRSDATGHDTPAGLEQRLATLEFLEQRLEIVDGHFEVSEQSLARCIGRLKPVIPASASRPRPIPSHV